MTKSIKRYVLITLLAASLVPLIAFATIFFTQTYSSLVQKDIENIKFTMDREKKHIEDFIQVNINDMSIIAKSDDIKGQKQDDIMGIFTRFMNARKDFDKVKYIYPDGKIIEVTKDEGGRVYRQIPISVTDIFCLNNGEFAMYSGTEEGREFIIYSSPVIIDGTNMGVVAGYMPVSNISFLTMGENGDSLGTIYIKDSRDRYITPVSDDIESDKSDFDVPIERTDWRIYANADKVKFARSTLKVIFSNIMIFFVLVIVAIIPIAMYIADYISKPMEEFVYCAKSLTKFRGGSPAFYNVHEAKELKRNFNKMIDLIENNKSEFEESLYFDKLTGLYNQRFIEGKLRDKIHLINNKKIYFLMLGVKTINNGEVRFQNGIWDVILSEIGTIISESIRFMDIPARFSQREFLIILTGADKDRILQLIKKIVSKIENNVLKIQGMEIKLKVEYGISEYNGDIGKSIDESSQFSSAKRKNS